MLTLANPPAAVSFLRISDTTHTTTGNVNYYPANNMIMVDGSFHDSIQHQNLVHTVSQHLDKYGSLLINFNYDLFAPTNLRYLFDIIRIMNRAKDQNKEVHIIWQCSNNDKMDQMGLDFVPFCDFSFFITY